MPRSIALTVLAGACVIAAALRHRRALARRLAEARRFMSHRLVDEEARASCQAVATWEDDGGAKHAPQ